MIIIITLMKISFSTLNLDQTKPNRKKEREE
jgi:hypothetical protein